MNPKFAHPPLRGELRLNEPMAGHVSWRAGGNAARAYLPADLADLAAFMQQTPEQEPLLAVGLGSNLLVRDGGYEGTVLFTHDALEMIRVEEDSSIYCGAGTPSALLARFCERNNRTGAEFLGSIPGTIGGALAMNAGCFGYETWVRVDKALTMNRHGETMVRPKSEFEIGYRSVRWRYQPEEIFIGAWFRFAQEENLIVQNRGKEFRAQRNSTQPLKLPNSGSVFRNPPGDFAGRLIEAAGMKGVQIGAVSVSNQHANFIVNQHGKGSASEIEMLIIKIECAVEKMFGIQLHREVRIVGTEAGTTVATQPGKTQ